ncbi:MAG: IS630 family transposase, partial [Oscillospiraceae bacterium]|nr:IS630 family transposase [Oscillospiraceae bacterium]
METLWNDTKKKTTRYKEQNPEKVEAYLKEIEDILPEKIAYVDKTGIDTCLYRKYAYALRGETVTERIPGKKFQRTNLVAAQLNGEIIAPMQYNGTTDAPLFEYWFKQWLLPCLSEDAVIIMDNTSFHRKGELFKIAAQYHRKLIFLPPYSPELNPIEHFWAKLKQWLKLHIKEFISLD